MSKISNKLSWGHININVSDLEQSISFYKKLGFEVFIPAIPYLNITSDSEAQTIPDLAAIALAVPALSKGRACIMQLDNGFPKLDLTEWLVEPDQKPLNNSDHGIVRICLATQDLETTYKELGEQGVAFISEPKTTQGGKADIAICKDPDGTLIELIQIYIENW